MPREAMPMCVGCPSAGGETLGVESRLLARELGVKVAGFCGANVLLMVQGTALVTGFALQRVPLCRRVARWLAADPKAVLVQTAALGGGVVRQTASGAGSALAASVGVAASSVVPFVLALVAALLLAATRTAGGVLLVLKLVVRERPHAGRGVAQLPLDDDSQFLDRFEAFL